MSAWKEMWERQKRQQLEFNLDPRAMSPMDKAGVAKDLSLLLAEESNDLARVCSHYKAHILKTSEPERGNVAEEAVDVLKVTLTILQLYGVSCDETFEAFMRKSDVISDKARGERLALERDTLVAIFDLDNVISDLSEWQNELNESRGSAPMNDRTVKLLESLKEDFYKDGRFTEMAVIDGAKDGLREIQELGYKIVIITARPYWQYKRIYADTQSWLQRHGICYDLILFNKDKAEAIYEHILPARPAFFVEDRAKHANEVADIGVHVLLYDNPGNQDVLPRNGVERVKSWKEIVEFAKTPKVIK